MRAIWKGALTFGLVNVPVKVYSATEDHDVSLHQVHNKDGGRIRYQRKLRDLRRDRAYQDIDKAYDDGERTVVLTADDLALAARRAQPRDRCRRVRAERAGRSADARQGVLPRARLRVAQGVRAAAQDARADRSHRDRAILAAPEDAARRPARARRRARAADPAVGGRGARGGVPGAGRAGADLGEGARAVGIPRRELRRRLRSVASSPTSTRTSCAPSSRPSSSRAMRSTRPRRSATTKRRTTGGEVIDLMAALRASVERSRAAREGKAADGCRCQAGGEDPPRSEASKPKTAKPAAKKKPAKAS